MLSQTERNLGSTCEIRNNEVRDFRKLFPHSKNFSRVVVAFRNLYIYFKSVFMCYLYIIWYQNNKNTDWEISFRGFFLYCVFEQRNNVVLRE